MEGSFAAVRELLAGYARVPEEEIRYFLGLTRRVRLPQPTPAQHLQRAVALRDHQDAAGARGERVEPRALQEDAQQDLARRAGEQPAWPRAPDRAHHPRRLARDHHA